MTKLPRIENYDARLPDVSDDGRFVIYEHGFGRHFFPGVRLYDNRTGTYRDLVATGKGLSYQNGAMPKLSADGKFATFLGCYDQLPQSGGGSDICSLVYRYDRLADEFLLVSVNPNGEGANQPSSHPSINANGTVVVFASNATNLVENDTNGVADIFINEIESGITTRITGVNGAEPNGNSYRPTISDNGAYVVFESDATNLIENDTNAICINGEAGQGMTCRDVFVYEIMTSTLKRVSVTTDGIEGNGTSFRSSLSADGQKILFISSSDNLVPNDSNGNLPVCTRPSDNSIYCYDLFLHDRSIGVTRRISLDAQGGELDGTTLFGAISPTGTYATFFTQAPEIVASCTSCSKILRVQLDSGVQSMVFADYSLPNPTLSISFDGNQIGFTGITNAYRTCQSESLVCFDAMIWDDNPSTWCNSNTDLREPIPTHFTGNYTVYLPLIRVVCRAGNY